MIDLSSQRNQGPPPIANLTRWLVRGMLLLGIVGLAYTQGFTPQGWMRLALAGIWAATLPWTLGGLNRMLRRTQLQQGPRLALVFLLGGAWITLFVLYARTLRFG